MKNNNKIIILILLIVLSSSLFGYLSLPPVSMQKAIDLAKERFQESLEGSHDITVIFSEIDYFDKVHVVGTDISGRFWSVTIQGKGFENGALIQRITIYYVDTKKGVVFEGPSELI